MKRFPVPAWQRGSWYQPAAPESRIRQDWEAMLGKAHIPPPMLKKGSFTMDNTVLEMKD